MRHATNGVKMKIENIRTPDTIKGLEKLAKDESVLVVYNIFTYLCQFYEKLADEKLKLWHYSPVMLGEMFVEADRTGVIPYPEEA